MKKHSKHCPLSIAIAITLGISATVSTVYAAPADEGFFHTQDNQALLALKLQGKPPYDRAKARRHSKKQSESVEMSALEIDENAMESTEPATRKTHLRKRRGHPDRSKRSPSLYQ